MKKLFPIIFLGIITFIFFWQFFVKLLLPIPSDALVGLYHPFRDFYSKDYPRGIPFKNFLITDPVRQQYPWRNLAVEDIKKGIMPLWNPYSLSGTPLIGTFQSAVFYPLNVLLLLLPFEIGWSLTIVLQVFMSLIFMYFFLRNLKLSEFSSILGGVVFALSGFMISWLEWGTVGHTALWLPLILLTIDKIFHKEDWKWYLVLIGSLCSSFFAGHLQTFFYVSLATVSYVFYNSIKTKEYQILLRTLFAFGISFILFLPQLLPSIQLINLSARAIDLNWHNPGWFIPFQNLIQFLSPDFFGNPATLNYWGIWNYAEFVGYIGVLPLILVAVSIFIKRREKLFFWSIILISLIFSLPTPIAQLPYLFNIPFLSSAQPTRLIFLIDFSLAVLAAFGLEELIQKKIIKPMMLILGIFSFAYVLLFFISLRGGIFFKNIDSLNFEIAKHNMILPVVMFLISGFLLMLYITLRSNKKSHLILIGIILLISFDLLRFSWKFTPFTNKDYLFPITPTINFLKKDTSLFRIMTDDSRILAPNFSDVYRIQSIEGYDPLYLLRYGELISAIERGRPDISSPFGFNRIITPHNYQSPLISLLNVKYLLSLSDKNDKNLSMVFREGETRIYKINNFIPRVFAVSKTIYSENKNESINNLFKYKDDLLSTAIVEGLSDNHLFDKGNVKIEKYSNNLIEIKTSASNKMFIVLLDSYYPTWKAMLEDGTKLKIYITDYNFRGIEVPAGDHTVKFYNNL